MRKASLYFAIILLSIIALSCFEIEDYPDTPHISFKEVEFKDSIDALDNIVKLCRLKFNITDGDGNIGLHDYDTLGRFHKDSVYYNNLFIKLFEKKESEYKEILYNPTLNYRTPYINDQGFNKSLKAEIQVKFEFIPSLFPYDTIQFEFYIVDRDFNKSNIVVSPDIPVE